MGAMKNNASVDRCALCKLPIKLQIKLQDGRWLHKTGKTKCEAIR